MQEHTLPDFSLTFTFFRDFSLNTLKLPDFWRFSRFSRFSRWVATL